MSGEIREALGEKRVDLGMTALAASWLGVLAKLGVLREPLIF